MVNKDELKAWVDKLGSFRSAVELAEFLHEEGVVGRAGYASSCPVANFLLREIGGEHGDIRVYPSGVMYRDESGDTRFDAAIINPSVVTDFVRGFDHGAYPFLSQGGEFIS